MVTIAPATREDVPRLAEIQRLAFTSMEVQKACFGHVTAEAEDSFTSLHVLKALDSPGTEAVWKAVLDEQIVGFALWRLPVVKESAGEGKVLVEESEQERKERIRRRFPEGADNELAFTIFGSLGIEEPHLHLSRLATDPLYQRRGVGAALLRWGCMEADKQGVDAYLKSSDVGIPVYKRAGFEFFRAPVGSATNPALRLYPMRRPPLLISLPLPSDLPAIASLHQRAFWPSHFFRMMFDSDTHCVQPSDWGAWHLQRLVKWSASEAEGEGTHVTAVAKRGELLLGYGHFMVHENVEGEEAEEEGGGDDYPEGTDLEAARSVFGGMEAAERLIKGKFVVLHQLGTDPSHQKTGAGRALLHWFVQKAHIMGFDELYLQATPAGRRLYDSMGFKQFAPTIVSVRGVEIYPMMHSRKEKGVATVASI